MGDTSVGAAMRPPERIFDLAGPFVEAAEAERAEVDIPFPVIDLDQADLLPAQRLTDIHRGALPADPALRNRPPKQRVLEFRLSSRAHDANTAREVGLYHFWAEGGEHYYRTVDSYLVKKNGR